MLQVAFGGYFVIELDAAIFDDSNIYREPGFTSLSPLELEIPECDEIYILIRKREDSSNEFVSLLPSDLIMTVQDVTTGQMIPSRIEINNLNAGWEKDPSSLSPLVGIITNSIDLNNPVERVRSLDCLIKDKEDNTFISFRITVLDSNKLFHYVVVDINNLAGRNKATFASRTASVKVNKNKDFHILLSPFAELQEVEEKKADFSYPLNSIFYSRQVSYDNEDFDFSIDSYNPSSIINNVSLINVPGYSKAAVLLIDRNLFNNMLLTDDNYYVNVKADGVISGISELFTIYFSG